MCSASGTRGRRGPICVDHPSWLSTLKNPHYIYTHMTTLFSTITFKDGIPDEGYAERLTKYLSNSKKFAKYVVVGEKGAYGKNNHYHLYIVPVRTIRTDSFTRSLRNLYNDTSYLNRHTVRTLVEKDPIYRLGYYMQKEQDHEVVCVKDIDMKAYKVEYQKRETTAQKLLIRKNARKYTIDQLPSVYLAYCDANKKDYKDFSRNFAELIRDGVITTSQVLKLRSVRIVVNVLKGADLDPEIYLNL